jgi:hypothetical protein
VPFRRHLVRLIVAGPDAWAHTAPAAVTLIEILTVCWIFGQKN